MEGDSGLDIDGGTRLPSEPVVPKAPDESKVMRGLREALSADDADAVRAAIWPLVEPMIDAAMTNRILQFHQAMASRGEISAPRPETDDSGTVH